jgi:hypothetical protein
LEVFLAVRLFPGADAIFFFVDLGIV